MGASDFDKLDDTNFGMWSYRMQMFLIKQELWEIVDGTEQKPDYGPNSAAVKKWEKKNRQAKAEIVLRVSDSQLVHTKYDNASEIWTKLQNVHKARGLATRLALRRQLHATRKEEDMPMARYVTLVQERAQQLRELDAKLDDEEIISVLTNLPSSYEALVVNLDSMDPDLRTVDYVVTRLINEDKRQGEQKLKEEADEDPMTLVARDSRSQTRGPPNRGKRPRAAQQPDRSKVTCFTCGGKGHYKSECPNDKDQHQERSYQVEEDEAEEDNNPFSLMAFNY